MQSVLVLLLIYSLSLRTNFTLKQYFNIYTRTLIYCILEFSFTYVIYIHTVNLLYYVQFIWPVFLRFRYSEECIRFIKYQKSRSTTVRSKSYNYELLVCENKFNVNVFFSTYWDKGLRGMRVFNEILPRNAYSAAMYIITKYLLSLEH